MKVTKKDLGKSQVELTIELSLEEMKPYMEQAAKEIAEQKQFEGFRPGKAPYDVVKQRVGDMAILQQATNAILGKTFYKAVADEKLDVVDQPQIDIVKAAPDNPFTYKATVSLLPEVTLTDYKSIKLEPAAETIIKDEEVDKVINDLRKMRATEKPVDRAIVAGDKAIINFETFIDKVPLSGGKSEKYPLVIGDGQMIPGFEDQLVGLKKDEEKEFELTFPKEYHNDKIAGKKAKFKVKVLEVHERELPALDDKLAEGMGLKTVLDLRNQIRSNLKQEKEGRAKQQKDVEMVTTIIEKSKFGDLPDSLVNSETHKMLEELKDNVAKQGLKWEDYLAHVKKKEEDLRLDFTADAIKRVKTALAIRQIAIDENIAATEEEIEAEADRTLKSYQMNPMYAQQMKQIEDNIKTDASKRYFANLITNRKVMKHLQETMIPSSGKKEEK